MNDVDLQSGIENAWSNVATFTPKLAAARWSGVAPPRRAAPPLSTHS